MPVDALLKRCIGFLVTVAVAPAAMAGLSDWQVTPGGTSFDLNYTANWQPYSTPGVNPNNASAAASGTTHGIDWTIWDNYGPHGNASDGTNLNAFGGQQFDAKALYLRHDNANLYVGLVTGFNPAGTSLDGVNYRMGDLAIDLDAAHSTARLGVITLTDSAGHSGSTQLVSGGTWNVPNGDTGWTDVPTNYLSGGAVVGNDIHYAYTNLGITYNDTYTQSLKSVYLLEWTIPISELGLTNGQAVSVTWGPSCSNDIITANHNVAVPEPGSLTAVGAVGLLALGRRRRRRGQRRA